MAKRTRLDIDRLLQTLQSPDRSCEEESWLHEQLRSVEIREALWELAYAVFPTELCRICIALLPYYVNLELMGKDAEAKYPQVKAHLDRCSACFSEYRDLFSMVSETYADGFLAASSYPAFDLSFLSQAVERPIVRWSQLWKDIASTTGRIHQLVDEINISLTTPFTQLAKSLRPALLTIPISAQRQQDIAADKTQTIQVLNLQYPSGNLMIRIGRGPVVAQRTALVIDVLQIEPSCPLTTARITLYNEQRQLMEQVGTDKAGTVRFEDVGAGRYLVQVRYSEDIWELPIILTASEIVREQE